MLKTGKRLLAMMTVIMLLFPGAAADAGSDGDIPETRLTESEIRESLDLEASRSEEPDALSEGQLIGMWYYNEMTHGEERYLDEEVGADLIMELCEDGSVWVESPGERAEGSWSLDGKWLTLDFDDGSRSILSYENERLIFRYNGTAIYMDRKDYVPDDIYVDAVRLHMAIGYDMADIRGREVPRQAMEEAALVCSEKVRGEAVSEYHGCWLLVRAEYGGQTVDAADLGATGALYIRGLEAEFVSAWSDGSGEQRDEYDVVSQDDGLTLRPRAVSGIPAQVRLENGQLICTMGDTVMIMEKQP